MSFYSKNKRRKAKGEKQAGSSQLKRAASSASDTPKFKKRCLDNDLPSLPEGETKETCQEHIKAMKKEMEKKSNRDKPWISELMKLTYPLRRECVVQEPANSTVENMLSTYPALKLVSELKAEFGRILSEPNAPKDAATNYRELEGKILEIAKQHNCKKLANLLKNAESIADDNPEEKSDIESCMSAMALQYLLKDKAAKDDLFFKICSEDESIDEAVSKSTYPRLVASGQLGDFSQFLIAADCKVLAKLNVDVPMAIALLVGVFYVFNIEYTPGVRGIFGFLEAIMLGRHHLAKTRIAVQKLIKEVGACKTV